MAKNIKKLEELFLKLATPEERLAYEQKKLKDKITQLEQMPKPEKGESIRGEKGEPGPIGPEGKTGKDGTEIEGEEIVLKINNLETIPLKQIDFTHIKNFPWHLTKKSNDDWGNFMGYGAYDLNIKAITLGQITANQNNYVTGLGGWFRISSDAARTITGFEGGTDGRGFILSNVGSFNITLANQSASSAAAYRIITGTGADIVLTPDDDIWILYDSTTERWRVIERGDTAFLSSVSDTPSVDLTVAAGALSATVLPAGVDHSLLANLTVGDPHTQYRLESADHSHQSTGLQGGTLDHGLALTGLTDDDHTQYALLAGRSGGQTLIGGTAAGDDLILRATSNATDGDIIFQSDPTTERMRILSTGELLVNATALISTELVSIQKNQNADTRLLISNTTSGTAGKSTLAVSITGGLGCLIEALSAGFTTSGIRVANTGVLIGNLTGGLNIGTTSNAQLSFWTNGSERGRFLSTGELLIGRTTAISTEIFSLEKNQNANTTMTVNNTTDGTAAKSSIGVSNNSFTTFNQIQSIAASHTTSGMLVADSGLIQCNKAAGLYIGTRLAAVPLILFTNDVERARFLSTGQLGLGVTSPTAILHLKAGTTAASTAPLKFNSGTSMTTAEAGAVEFTTDDLFFTITTGAARKGIVLDNGARLTSGKIPIATTNGRLIDGQTPLAGTKVYYVADSSGGAVTRKLTFVDGILTAEV